MYIKYLVTILFFVLSTLVACSDSDFSGGAVRFNEKEVEEERDPELTNGDNPEGYDNDDGDDGLTIGSSDATEGLVIGEDEADCTNDEEAIEAAEETFVFGHAREITDFVNSKCKAGISTNYWTAGSVSWDDLTNEIICNAKGYKSAIAFRKGGYSSPHDNFLAYWHDSKKKIVIVPAIVRGNMRLDGLTCKGRFVDSCYDDAAKFDCEAP